MSNLKLQKQTKNLLRQNLFRISKGLLAGSFIHKTSSVPRLQQCIPATTVATFFTIRLPRQPLVYFKNWHVPFDLWTWHVPSKQLPRKHYLIIEKGACLEIPYSIYRNNQSLLTVLFIYKKATDAEQNFYYRLLMPKTTVL